MFSLLLVLSRYNANKNAYATHFIALIFHDLCNNEQKSPYVNLTMEL